MYEFHIPKMSCGGCVDTISKAIKRVDDDATLKFDLSTRTVHVDSKIDRQKLVNTMSEAGYPPS
jgi:copper chaperone